MKSSSDRTVAVLHLLVAIALALLQPREPLPKSAGVRVAVQTSVWAKAGAAARASSASTQARATRRGLRGAGRGAGGGSVLDRCARRGAGRWAIMASAPRAPAVTLLLESSLTLSLLSSRPGPAARSGCTPCRSPIDDLRLCHRHRSDRVRLGQKSTSSFPITLRRMTGENRTGRVQII